MKIDLFKTVEKSKNFPKLMEHRISKEVAVFLDRETCIYFKSERYNFGCKSLGSSFIDEWNELPSGTTVTFTQE